MEIVQPTGDKFDKGNNVSRASSMNIDVIILVNLLSGLPREVRPAKRWPYLILQNKTAECR